MSSLVDRDEVPVPLDAMAASMQGLCRIVVTALPPRPRPITCCCFMCCGEQDSLDVAIMWASWAMVEVAPRLQKDEHVSAINARAGLEVAVELMLT
jgi:hypothetical protein